MKKSKNDSVEIEAFYRSPNEEVNSTLRALAAFRALCAGIGVTIERTYLLAGGITAREEEVSGDPGEENTGAQPNQLELRPDVSLNVDVPLQIYVDFGNIGGKVEARALGVIVNHMRAKRASSSVDNLFDWTAWDSRQVFLNVVLADGDLRNAVYAKMNGLFDAVLKAEEQAG